MADRRRPATGPLGLLIALLIVLLVGGVLVAATSPAGAQEPGVAVEGEPCTDGAGVTVVIDFQQLGDDTVLVRCAPEAPADGFSALEQAGISYRTATSFPGFLCRIADRPDDDPCTTASPATAYWSYWLAPAGGEWCYSNKGAANRTPPPGAVEGWSFALDRTEDDVPPPRLDPPAPPAGVTPQPLAADDCTTVAASGSGRDQGAEPATTVGQGAPVDLDAEADAGGSPIGVVVAIGAIVVLVAVAVVATRRRRRNPGDPAPPEPPSDDRWRPGTPDDPDRPRPTAPSGPSTTPADGDGWSAILRHEPSADDDMWAPPDAGSSG